MNTSFYLLILILADGLPEQRNGTGGITHDGSLFDIKKNISKPKNVLFCGHGEVKEQV